MSTSRPLIDFHSHILPGADHGSTGLEESRKQLAIVRNAGVDTIVATPHFYPQQLSVDGLLSIRSEAYALLAPHIPEGLSVRLGAEVLYCPRIHEMEGLDRLCVEGTKSLLLELPTSPWDRELFYTVERLLRRYRVVLAHIDRYAKDHSDQLFELLDMGALAQINASSLTSFFSRRRLLPFLQNGSVYALGSDLHGSDPSDYLPFVKAPKLLGDRFDEIMSHSLELL